MKLRVSVKISLKSRTDNSNIKWYPYLHIPTEINCNGSSYQSNLPFQVVASVETAKKNMKEEHHTFLVSFLLGFNHYLGMMKNPSTTGMMLRKVLCHVNTYEIWV
jgi:hypothetical protein